MEGYDWWKETGACLSLFTGLKLLGHYLSVKISKAILDRNGQFLVFFENLTVYQNF